MVLGMTTSVSSSTNVSHTKIMPTNIGSIAMKLGGDIHMAQKMYPTD